MPRTRRKNRETRGRKRAPRRGVPSKESGNLVLRPNPRFPNDVKQLPIHNRVIRYSCTAQTNFQLTPLTLLQSILGVLNGNAACVQIIGSVRLRRISLYSVPSTNDFGNATSELSFKWLGDLNAPGNLITDRGTSTVPACIKVIPPTMSIASMWFTTTTDSTTLNQPFCAITCIDNTVMDLDFDYIVANDTTVQVTLTAAANRTGVALTTIATGVVPDGGVYTVIRL